MSFTKHVYLFAWSKKLFLHLTDKSNWVMLRLDKISSKYLQILNVNSEIFASFCRLIICTWADAHFGRCLTRYRL